MIIDEKIKIKLSNKIVGHYRKKNKDLKSGDIIEIHPTELPLGSNKKIKVQCSNCKTIKEISYYDYNKITDNDSKKYYCQKCKGISIKNGTQEKYGVDNVFQLNSVKEKSKETCKEKYGVEHHLQNQEILEKQKNTIIEKYGVEYLMRSDKIKEKSKETCLDKYGVDVSSKSEIVKENTKINNNQKYGVDYTSQLESVKNKIKVSKEQHIFDKYSNMGLKSINGNMYLFNCDKNHEYEIHSGLLYHRIKYETVLCTKCNPINSYNISGLELQLQDFIKDNYNGDIIFSTRNVINPYELDIYLPELKISFEFNGLYWHNELNKSNDYHYKKTKKCLEKDIQLIHIYEDDWKYKNEIVKSRIMNIISNTNKKIYARKCEVKNVDNKESKQFLIDNHIQGFVGSKYKIGLYHNDELVSLMTFGKTRNPLGYKSNENDYELLRFCSKKNTNVVGGASKLFKYFVKNYNYDSIISYADRSWSKGDLYEKLGFVFISETKPNYYYVIDDLRHYRYNFRKDILVKEGYDANKSEHEIMLDRKIYRIYDSGTLKYVLK